MVVQAGHIGGRREVVLLEQAGLARSNPVGGSEAAGFELNLDAKVPVLVEPVVAGKDETGNGDGICTVERARAPTVEDNLRIVVHELGQNLAVEGVSTHREILKKSDFGPTQPYLSYLLLVKTRLFRTFAAIRKH